MASPTLPSTAASSSNTGVAPKPLSLPLAILLSLAAASLYGVAFATRSGGPAILLALPCFCLLARVSTARRAFYVGLCAGIITYAPHLLFFFNIFGLYAPLLWIIAAFPVGLFVLLLYHARKTFQPSFALLLTPILWTGVEYFRSELWYLRFAWLLPAQTVAYMPGVGLAEFGVYGIGFAFAILAAYLVSYRRLHRMLGYLVVGALVPHFCSAYLEQPLGSRSLQVAGVQLQFPLEEQVVAAVDRLATAHPDAELLVLSECTFDKPVPDSVRAVVRKHGRYLIAGGQRPLPDGRFHNTAFVVGPDGNDVFEQAKSVPVQFMNDGVPAPHRRVWDSPWGKIGILICYDLSYARVCDDFVRQGAQALIIPTLDVDTWGAYERTMLHGRLAPIRSVEYNLPTFGVWGAGVSQLTDRHGRITATAPYPGQGEMIAGELDVSSNPRLPPDRLLAPVCVAITAGFIGFLFVRRFIAPSRSTPSPSGRGPG